MTTYHPIPVPLLTPLLTEDKRRQGTIVVDLAMHVPANRQTTLGIEIRNLLGRDLFPYEPDGVTPRPQRTVLLVVNWKG